ncbi:GNAT family N-acetyltransferase [Methylobacter tundripaludum]|uniref:GNAT family N-acetyltransferase n=1 Tax=Methylobacter tundripaludum TaxID=173365 RepID=UPI0004DFB669|nr:GNAT family N-acetyltransferase [Methylobacter tundripaludum]
MNMTIDDIKSMLDSGEIPHSNKDVVKNGVLLATDGSNVNYQLHHGWDIAKAYACDKSWGIFNIELMRFIKSQNHDTGSLTQVLAKIQMDDSHWSWFDKSRGLKTTEYDWFFLMTEQSPQGACLIYHPKASALDKGDIFYIEYVAVAPWNRGNPMRDQVFKGVGSILIKHAVNYARTELKLRYGFSLHALPRAAGFYQKIGMIRHTPLDKDVLQYFEMLEQRASEFAVG